MKHRGALGGPRIKEVVGRKVYGIKMLTSKNDYREAALTQFTLGKHETIRKGCKVNPEDNEVRGHSFSLIGTATQSDFCYTTYDGTGTVTVRLHMETPPAKPTVCLYEPGTNDQFDNIFHGKKAKDFTWGTCPATYPPTDPVSSTTDSYHNFRHFAINNPNGPGSGPGSARSSRSMFSVVLPRSPDPHPAHSGRIAGKCRHCSGSNTKGKHGSHATVILNCTLLPELRDDRCSNKSKTEDVCGFLEAAMDLEPELPPDDDDIKARRLTMNLIDSIFEKICINVSRHLPNTVSRVLVHYLKAVQGLHQLKPMKIEEEPWKFLIKDLQTCLEKAEPMEFRVDEDDGGAPSDYNYYDYDYDYDDNDSDSDTSSSPGDNGRKRSARVDNSIDIDYYDDGTLSTRRKRQPDILAPSSFVAPDGIQKSGTTRPQPAADSNEEDNSQLRETIQGVNTIRQKRAPQGPPNPTGATTDIPPVSTTVAVPSTTEATGHHNASGRAGGHSATLTDEELLARWKLPRRIQEVEDDEGDDEHYLPVMPANIEVIYREGRGRRRKRGVTVSGVKLFYYEEAAEIEFEFNAAIDAHWKIFSTVLGYCNKHYAARKAENFPRLYTRYSQDFLDPVEEIWTSPADNEALEVVVSEFSEPATMLWLDSCMEASYIVADSRTYRPPRSLLFPEPNLNLVTNYFNEVPPYSFYHPNDRRSFKKLAEEPNAFISKTGVASGRRVKIPDDPGCHWQCNSADDCHKICGASDKENVRKHKPFKMYHGHDGEKIPIEVEDSSDEEEEGETATKAPQLGRTMGMGVGQHKTQKTKSKLTAVKVNHIKDVDSEPGLTNKVRRTIQRYDPNRKNLTLGRRNGLKPAKEMKSIRKPVKDAPPSKYKTPPASKLGRHVVLKSGTNIFSENTETTPDEENIREAYLNYFKKKRTSAPKTGKKTLEIGKLSNVTRSKPFVTKSRTKTTTTTKAPIATINTCFFT